ncbi:unnamed protein product [Ilex paraguariensis]|uniref:Glutaredoxin domain-containing protein n=1 Tax=Ilex paraguariensis TaxID=185542 RepID=A0ABC8QUU9_9AQUA
MKRVREKLLKKVKSISTLASFKHGLIFQEYLTHENFQIPPVHLEQEQKSNSLPELVPGDFRVPEHLNDVKDEELDSFYHGGNQGNFKTPLQSRDMAAGKYKKEITVTLEYGSDTVVCTSELSDQVQKVFAESQSCDFNLDPLMEIDKLACLEPVIKEHGGDYEENDSEEHPLLLDFEEKCPPGGSESVILYTTSMRGIRKTFEDCNTIRFLLESFRVLYSERDVSMHLEYREELWKILGGRVVPPRLFIKGRHIGGAHEVVALHEQGKLRQFLQGIPANPSNGPCSGCAGLRFVLCFNCNGSRKVINEGEGSESPFRCPKCNENGLVICNVCC